MEKNSSQRQLHLRRGAGTVNEFIQGVIMGLAYSAPIGMQNLFVINTAIGSTRRRALFTAAAVICFDVALILSCFFGAGAVMQRFEGLRMAVLLAGSLIVIWLGAGLLREKVSGAQAENIPPLPGWKVISTAFVVTWLNPQALIDGTLMLGAFRAALAPSGAASFITGAVCASALWFTVLSLTVSALGSRISDRVLRIINLVCGLVMTVYGVKLLWSFLGAAGIGL